MSSHVTRYSVMPIPAVAAHTKFFQAGAIKLGVEYRLLTNEVVAAAQLEAADGTEMGPTTEFDDHGVSIHVFGTQDGEEREFLRFDCFVEDPHYHYICWREQRNEMLHMDPAATGDPVDFALESIERRLPALLRRAGAPELAETVDAQALARVLPAVRSEAMRVRMSGGDTPSGRDEAAR